ncbi:hypothetical protein CJF30_00002483 [Rutstroemia sp. NJR-2017a BBW]|nr:hypothetical protein CJF30_00002483 [Rutstroemia sp. NJR-2017a BBW]
MSTNNSAIDQFDVEPQKLSIYEKDEDSSSTEIKLDQHGFPLVPQPSQFKDDPLNWPTWLKWAVLIQVGFMAFLGPYNSALINPSLVLLADALNVDPKTAAYATTTSIILGGLSPFIYTPLTNIYGRRPITLFAIVLTIVGGIASARVSTFPALVGTRAICGIGFGGMMSVGTSCVNDMFFFHQRGEATGIYSVFVTNGAHVAAIIGGYLGQSLGWRWDYWIGAISTSISLFFAIFLFPETLFPRDPVYLSTRTTTRTYMQLLFDFRGNVLPNHPLRFSHFLESFKMLKYPSILFPFWYYTWAWTFINVLPAITLATIYTQYYNMKSGPIGACLGVSLMIGSILGEFSAGKASDYVMYRMARARGDIISLCSFGCVYAGWVDSFWRGGGEVALCGSFDRTCYRCIRPPNRLHHPLRLHLGLLQHAHPRKRRPLQPFPGSVVRRRILCSAVRGSCFFSVVVVYVCGGVVCVFFAGGEFDYMGGEVEGGIWGEGEGEGWGGGRRRREWERRGWERVGEVGEVR